MTAKSTWPTKSAWHIHDRILVEPLLGPIENRRAYIREYKPKDERPLRLRLLKEVKGRLPPAYEEAFEAYARAARARAARARAGAAYWKAINENMEIKALHQKECPNCPWDGQTIFSERQS